MNQPAAEDAVNVTDPMGTVGSLPKSQANEALENGYKLATPDEVHVAKNEQMFGGPAKEIYSAGLGAARTATLGGSDWMFTHLPKEYGGFSPEELKGFSETNPTATGIGEVAGILRDPLALGKLIGETGKAATSGATKALKAAGIAEDASAAAKTLYTGAHGLGTAVEGGLYGGVASTVNELAMGDPNLNSEKILANVGYGTLLGGGAGTVFKALGYGITPAIKTAANALNQIKNDLVGSGYGEEALIHKVLPAHIAEAITDRQLNLDTKGQASVLRKIVTNLNDLTGNIQNEVKSFEKDIDPTVMSSLFKSSAKVAREAQYNIGSFLTNATEYIKKALPEFPVQGQQMTDSIVPRAKLFEELEYLKKKINFDISWGDSSEKIFNSLGKLKQNIEHLVEKEPEAAEALSSVNEGIDTLRRDPKIFGASGAASAIHEENVGKLSEFISLNGKRLTPFQKTFGAEKGGKWQFDISKLNEVLAQKDPIKRSADLQMLNDFFTHMKEMPDNMLNARRAIPNSRWKSTTLKQIISNAEKTNEQAFNDYVEGINKRRPLYGWKDYAPVLIAKWHPVIAAAIEAYDWYQDPVHATHGLALVERMLGQTGKKSVDLIESIFNPSSTTRIGIEGKIESPSPPTKKTTSDNDEDHKNIKKWSGNPQLFSEQLEKQTKELSQIAPQLAQSIHISTGNAISFLASKMPQGNDHQNPFAEKHQPSESEISKFNRYRQVVENPLVALEQIKDRTLGPETIETLSVVYPKLYDQLKQDILEKAFTVKQKGVTISFQTKQALSNFLGEPLDQSLSPQSILANQMIMAGNQNSGQMAPQQEKPRAKGLDKMDRVGRMSADYGAMSDRV